MEVGSAVTSLKVGDSVYSRVPSIHRGTVAEYCLSTAATTALKPDTLDFTHAAAIPLAAMTALQCLERAEQQLPNGLKNKTIFIPGGLSATGSFAVQLAINIFGAGRIVTSLSTGKIVKAKEIWGDGSVVEYVDYTEEDIITKVGRTTVDFMFDTMGQAMGLLPIMKKGGVVVSISTSPSGSMMKQEMPNLPRPVEYFLNFMNWYYTWRSSRCGVKYSFLLLDASAKDLDKISGWVKQEKLYPLVGSTAKFRDLEGVRKGCQQVYDGKGGVGKFVVDIV